MTQFRIATLRRLPVVASILGLVAFAPVQGVADPERRPSDRAGERVRRDDPADTRTQVEIRESRRRDMRAGKMRVVHPDPDAKEMPPSRDGGDGGKDTGARVIRVSPPLGGASQVEKGPEGVLNGQSENATPGNKVVGACNALAPHPSDSAILYAGFTNGGIWKTVNANAADPTWTPLTDAVGSLSIGAIQFDPTDATRNTLVAVFNSNSSLGGLGGTPIGMIRTTDGGTTWTVLSGGGTLAGQYLRAVVARGAVLLAASVSGGIYRSTNTGTTFVQVSGNGGSGLPFSSPYALQGDPANNAILYTAVSAGGGSGVYKSVDTGATWVRVSDAAMNAAMDSPSDIRLAVGNSGNVYAAVATNGRLSAVYRSGDSGATWAAMGAGNQLPGTTEGATFFGIHPGGQGDLHFSLAADPSNANLVYVGGDRQPGPAESVSFPNSIGAANYSGRLFRGDASQPPGSQWKHLTHSSSLGPVGGGTAGNSAPHADSRAMAFDAGGRLIEGDDGGVFARTSPAGNTGNWFSLQGTLRTSEVHDAAYDSRSKKLLVGCQDNGTAYQDPSGTWSIVQGGDGGDVAVDVKTLAGSSQSLRYTSFQNLGTLRRRTYDSAGNQVTAATCTLTTVPPNEIAAQFYTPIKLNRITPTRLLVGATNGLYESFDQGATAARPNGNTIWAGDGNSGVGLAYGGRKNGVDNADATYVVDGSRAYVRETLAGGFASATLPTGGDILLDVVMDSNNYSAAFSVDRNQVFQTLNTGGAWTDVTGDLTGVGDFRCVEFVPNSAGGVVVVGTQTGVYFAQRSAMGSWRRLGTNLPAAAYVFDLTYDATDNILVAGTLGRGVWTLPNASTVVSPNAAGEWRNYE